MIQNVNGVGQLASEFVAFDSSLIPFSSTLASTFRAFHIAHFCFHTGETYSLIQGNKALAISGGLLHITAGNLSLVRGGAKLVAVSRALFECLAAQKEVVKSYGRLSDNWESTYPQPIGYLQQKGKLDTVDANKDRHLLTYTHAFPKTLMNSILKTEALGQQSGDLGYKLFILSCRLNEVYQSMFINTDLENVFCVGINAKRIWEEYTHDTTKLSEEIEQNPELYNKMLRYSNSHMTAQELSERIKQLTASPANRKLIAQSMELGRQLTNTVSYLITGSAPGPVTALEHETYQPYYQAEKYADLTVSASCKASKHEPQRFYVSHQPRRPRYSDEDV